MPHAASAVRRPLVAAVVALLAVLLVPAAASAAERNLYVSLGDSYAAGFQATGQGQGRFTRNGFAYQVPRFARSRGWDLKLVNFGCGGETTTSILRRTTPCGGPAPGGPDYAGRTQADAATRFIRRNRDRIALITVSIGGNDVTSCARGGVDPLTCVGAAVEDIKENVGTLVSRLREAAGPTPRIRGITYPDVVLGGWVTGQPADQDVARLSVPAFKALINPALRAAYRSVRRGRFVDVTAATGAYGPLDELVTFEPYGVIPKPVAEVCRLTYYCEFRDIHARTVGYRKIAEMVAASLPDRTG